MSNVALAIVIALGSIAFFSIMAMLVFILRLAYLALRVADQAGQSVGLGSILKKSRKR
jgi:hypothetical protein